MDSAALTQDAYSAPETPETVAPTLEPAAPRAERPGWSLKGLLALLIFFGLLAAGAWYALHDAGYQDSMRKAFSEASGTMYRTLVTEIVLNPWFYGVFGLVLLLEWLIPAKQGQGSLSRGARHDLLWVVAKLAIYAWALPLYIIFLRFLYNQHLSFLTIQSVVHWPWAARLALAFLVNDFLFYVSHVVRHKVGFLWYFHAVHHSQKEMNFFTEYRVHPLDDVFIYTIGFIPLFMVESSFVMVMAAVWLGHWHTRLYHANIRSNFGPLRYVLVTPQSHRVHHSIEPRHHDKNFGLTFSIWDQLFGTQYRGYDEYPDTGIDDEDFPFEQNPGRLGYLGLLCGQFFYPFRAILRG